MIRCAIYDRVSTDLQVEKGLSLDTQKAALTQYANDHGYIIVDYYEDEGITARKKMQNRKDLMRLLEDVKADKIDIILVTKLDRWFRNVKDYHNTQEILNAHNCTWKTIFEDYDSSTADGQLKINIMLAVAQNECDRTSERIKAVFRYKESQGKVISSRMAPYGYKVVDGYIQKDEAVSHIVADAFERYFKSYSIRDVYRYLTNKYGDDAPSFNITDRFFKNEKYSGYFKDDPNWCEPYISRDDYNKMRSICSTKTTSSEGAYLFSSLIKCPICNNNFTGFRKKRPLKNGGVSICARYRCPAKYNKHGGANIAEKTVEAYMIEHIVQFLNNDIMRLKTLIERDNKKHDVSAVKKEIERLNTMYQKGRITDEYYDKQYDELSKKLSVFSKAVDAEKVLVKREASLDFFKGDWLHLYNALTPENKQVFWKTHIKEIYVDPNTHLLCGFIFR